MTDFRGTGKNTYEGEQTEAAYAAWLRQNYGDVPSRFPPGSVVAFEGKETHEFVVTGYALAGDQPTVAIVDIAQAGCRYEELAGLSRHACPEHDLPRLKYLYNLNGETVAEKFRTEPAKE